MDITVSLIPSNSHTNLYVNAAILPTEFKNYYWKEEGALGKRITITWEELVEMKL